MRPWTGIILAMLLAITCDAAPSPSPQAPQPSQQQPSADASNSDPARLNGRPISRIDFDPAEQPFPREQLDPLLTLHPGEDLTPAKVRSTIQNLFNTGRYANISVEGSEDGPAVAIRIVTEAAVFVGQITVNGAKDPPNEAQLAGASKLVLGTEFAPNDINTAVENMQERLRANGFYLATILPSIEPDPSRQQVRVDFRINPGERAKFDRVNLAGDPQRTVEAVLSATRWRRFWGLLGWRPATETRVRGGVDNLLRSYQKNDRLLARVTLQRLQYHDDTNRLTPFLFIEPGPKIVLRARGLKMSSGKLRQFIPIFQERAVDRDLLVEGRRNLIEYFQSQGYFDAQADFELLPRTDNQQIIEYVFDRGQRRRLVSLALDGNRYFDSKTIRERMVVTPATLIRYRRGRYSQKLMERDVEAVESLYRSNGFLDIKVAPDVANAEKGKPGDLGVKLRISEGPQWFVNRLEWEGVSDEDKKYFESVLNSLEGQPFSETNVINDRDNILSYYVNMGYPDAAFEWSQSDSGRPNQVNLKFVVRTGRRQYVRDVLVSGIRNTNPQLVQNRIRFAKGEPLSDANLSDTQRRLYDLGIFAKVQVAIQNPTGQEDAKYVLYQLDEARRYSINAGFGAELARIGGGTSLNAPAGGAGFSPRVLLGVSRINFLGLGHTVSLQTRASNIQQRALLSYFAPQFQNSQNLNLTITGLFDSSRDVRTFTARRLEGSIQLGQQFTRANSVQYRYAYRRVTVDQNTLNINPQLIPLFAQPARTSIISSTFIQDRRDDPLDARRGLYNTVDAGVSATALGSQTSFFRLVARNSTYHRLSPTMTLARNTNLGLIERFGGQPGIPLPERFFSGGAYSHRGFPNNQAGPRDDLTGFPLGGNALLFNAVELRFPLVGDNLGGVLFHDMGNVFTSLQNINLSPSQRGNTNFDYMVHAVGFGFRYRTPIGPLRVDLAYAPNSPRFVGFQGTRDELLLCGAVNQCASVQQRISRFQFHFSLGQAF